MDILIPLLLVLAMYLIPELLRRRGKPYEYPQIPDNPDLYTAKEPDVEKEKSVKVHKVLHKEPYKVPISNYQEEKEDEPISEGFSQNDLIRGIIFSEILQRPRGLPYRLKNK